MKKFLILLSATLIASSVNAQLYITQSGNLTYGDISSVSDCTTAWEGIGHFFHNGASSGGQTWLKLDLKDKYPAFVSGNNVFTLRNNSGGPLLFIDMSRNKPYIYSNSSSLFFKNNNNCQSIYAGSLYTVAEMRSGSAYITDALDKVVRLSPRQFEPGPISARRSRFYGFLSSDMERVLPELVSQDTEGAKYISYVELIPILTKAIQDLTLKVHEQEERIAQLEQQSIPKTKQ